MEQHETEAALLPNIANQMRSLLSNLYLAASQVIPPEQREQGPSLGRQGRHFGAKFFSGCCGWSTVCPPPEYLSDSQRPVSAGRRSGKAGL